MKILIATQRKIRRIFKSDAASKTVLELTNNAASSLSRIQGHVRPPKDFDFVVGWTLFIFGRRYMILVEIDRWSEDATAGESK